MDPSRENKHIFKVIDALHDIYEVCYGSRMFMTPDELVRLDLSCNKLGRHYQWLAVQAMHKDQYRWQQRPKLHYVVGHLAWQAKLINPIRVQGYVNESMVGTVARIHHQSMSGPHHKVSSGTVLRKYLTGMVLDWLPGSY